MDFPGFIRPLGGLPYLLAMFAVGLLSVRPTGRPGWIVPAAFGAGTVIGAAGGLAGLVWPLEPGLAATLLLVGAVLTARRATPRPVIAAVGGMVGLLYGYAQGLNPAPAAVTIIYIISYLGGLLVAVAGMPVVGGLTGLIAARSQHGEKWLRATGVLVAVFGAGLLLSL